MIVIVLFLVPHVGEPLRQVPLSQLEDLKSRQRHSGERVWRLVAGAYVVSQPGFLKKGIHMKFYHFRVELGETNHIEVAFLKLSLVGSSGHLGASQKK